MSWLWSLLAKLLGTLVDKWVAFRATRESGAAEERERALREAQRQEDEARRAAEEAASRPTAEDDGWRRD